MRTRAKIEEEIAALATEVRELARKRGAGLPDVNTLVEFIVAAFGAERAHQVAGAVDARGAVALGEAVRELQIAPGAEMVRACVVTVFQAVDRGDFPDYKRDTQALREALVALLEARAAKWPRLCAGQHSSIPSVTTAGSAEHVRAVAAKLTRWEVLVWAGRALSYAVEDVWLWRLWQAGWREYREDSRQRGQSGMTEEAWQREVVHHALAEAEAQVVDSWPVPPDDEWPQGNTKLLLPRLRKWQADLSALEASLGKIAERSGAQ